ncbi:unnamed protein product [Brachionus calyciflorus]|uniref:Uncharacterized protein n=1 Tax=Brachionus calyciflorus TaxID=104777 RepID=A0A814GDL2_9BILA|nr:unnamed protein product [Brachionus calyciflorus]
MLNQDHKFEDARKDLDEDISGFCKAKIFKMGRFIRLYSELMRHFNVNFNEDLLEEISELDENFEQRIKNFLIEWDYFLNEFENRVSIKNDSCLELDQYFPDQVITEKIFSKIALKNSNEFNLITLDELHSDFRQQKLLNSDIKKLQRKAVEFIGLNCQVVLVSFGESKGAYRWLKENQITNSNQFDMITDQERHLYKLFGLPNSYSKVWNSETLVYYAEQLIKIGKLPGAYEDIEDDPHQMGGNFIMEFNDINTNGNSKFKLVYAYKSKNPPDRPSAVALLNFLKSKF